ncbi:ATP-binding protein [Halogeometricum sp. S1BR25-6]|uniref:histidine kinase n=1 Tax=Halogeometricum salsisoli TaxID=2950536 RepID=A0ABU2GAB0_9EURY|nr:histidine kinase N-terminal 7TM domain-containing protein [Halogeometricum sp. S1BR25-6]MDS0297747.1 ATP-binding protein [Halogeometricum sp. S1BR25-6]
MNPLVVMLFVSVAVGSAAAIRAWRERPEPGATPLVAMLSGQCWWSACIIFKLQAAGIAEKLLWTRLGWLGVVVIPVAWLLFALEYTGRDQFAHPRHVVLLSVVPAITVVLAATGDHHQLLYVQSYLVDANGIVQVHQGGHWYWFVAGYTYLLGLSGVILLVDLLASESVTFRTQGVALVVGLLAPWVTNALFIAGALPSSSIDPTPVAFSLSGAIYLGALTRFRLIGTSPAPRKRARQFLFDRMQEGAVVVDVNHHVVDINDVGIEILGVDACEALGSPASAVIPEYDRFPEEGALSGYLTVGDEGGGRSYDVTVTRITNVRGVPIGRVVTFHDVSRHLRQQQRLEVLNRILRHNIRTETNVIHGYVDRFADHQDARVVKRRALRIEEIGRKGREAIELFDEGHEDAEAKPLADLLGPCVDGLRESHPDAVVDYDPPDEDIAVAGLLKPVFSNALANAVEHNPSDRPRVQVTTRVEGDRVRVSVADDGPGIDDYELRALTEGTESALVHGSGLGLWIVKWGAEIAGGEVRFAENDPTGSVVTVDVPLLDRSADGRVAGKVSPRE